MPKLYYNFILTVSLLSFYGAFIYYIYQLDYLGVFFTLILSAVTFILLKKNKIVKKKSADKNQILSSPDIKKTLSGKNLLSVVFFCLLLIANLVILFQSSTAESIISPWETVPWYFFLIFSLATLLLIVIFLKTQFSNSVYFLLFSFYCLSIFGISLIIYDIGFGFDPFVHQATEKLISLNGSVYPKPLYYLGQYGLITVLHKILFAPIIWLDKLLVPLSAAFLLPFIFFKAFKKFTGNQKERLLSTLIMLILPFSLFTITTPQNLANLFLILLVLTSFAFNNILLSLVLALTIFAIHPIAGIPAILFIAILWAKNNIKTKKLLFAAYCLLFVASAAALPVAFLFTNNSLNISEQTTQTFFNLPKLFFSDTGNIWLNFSYLYGFNIFWIILLLIITGIILSSRAYLVDRQDANGEERRVNHALNAPYLLMLCALIISFFITKTLNFSYLINYEQSNFANRILALAVIFSLPFIMATISFFVKKILGQNVIIKYSFICFLVFLLSCSVYHSYPRFDDYYNSRSFSTSQSDINAVRWINQDANNNDNYIVLANQQVSAAALKEFGFKKYFNTENGELFYYPIPTGDKLYSYYLTMVDEKADKKTALKAADLVGADTVYFVLNNYWFGFEKILTEAEVDADDIKKIDDGKIFIFKYLKQK